MDGWVKLREGYCRAKLVPSPYAGSAGRMYVPKWDRFDAPHVMPDTWSGGWVALNGSPDKSPFPSRLLPGVTFPTAEAAMVAVEVELANRVP